MAAFAKRRIHALYDKLPQRYPLIGANHFRLGLDDAALGKGVLLG